MYHFFGRDKFGIPLNDIEVTAHGNINATNNIHQITLDSNLVAINS